MLNTINLYGEELLACPPTSLPCRLSATAYSIHSQLPYIFKAFLYPETEDAPCRGEREQLIMDGKINYRFNFDVFEGYILQINVVISQYNLIFRNNTATCFGPKIVSHHQV